VRVAIATKGYKGLDDELSDVLARSPTITIVDVNKKERSYSLVEIIKNKALRFRHGSGPIFADLLAEKKVELVVGPEIGMSVKELFGDLGIKFLKFKPRTKVKKIIESILEGK
jgi:predicted Fe-Mo cluster-binding NifX family protein